jgi:hypothetical protein
MVRRFADKAIAAREPFNKQKDPQKRVFEARYRAKCSALASLVALVDLIDDVDATAPADQLVGAMTAHQGLERIADFHRATFRTETKRGAARLLEWR